MTDRNELIAEMKKKVLQLRNDIDRLTEAAQKDARYKFHRLKDELNELDKTIDKIREIADDSWLTVQDDVQQMWQKLRSEVDIENLTERNRK